MDAQGIINTLLNFGPGGVLAAICFYKWQQAEDRNDKLRDAFDLKTEQYHQAALLMQSKGFENSLRVEGVLTNATTVIAANSQTIAVITKQGAH